MSDPTHQLTFDTVTQENRVEQGVMADGVLRTNHENRPDFRPNDDGTVDLITANHGTVIEDFGTDATIEEVA